MGGYRITRLAIVPVAIAEDLFRGVTLFWEKLFQLLVQQYQIRVLCFIRLMQVMPKLITSTRTD